MDSQSQAWDSAHWEFTLVFEDLRDEDLWRRAHPSLLSVGEITAHVIYGLVDHASTVNPAAQVRSSLKRDESRYYLTAVDTPLKLALTVKELEAEFVRVQKEVKAALHASGLPREAPLAKGPGNNMGELVDYMVFHVAYHTGQAFSVRHLMGHRTNDN